MGADFDTLDYKGNAISVIIEKRNRRKDGATKGFLLVRTTKKVKIRRKKSRLKHRRKSNLDRQCRAGKTTIVRL